MTEQTGTRKPTAAQKRMIVEAINRDSGEVVSTSRRDDAVVERCAAAGWVDARTSLVTRAGHVEVGMADRFALPEVKVGDLLRYVTHPGCVVRVRQVLDGGRTIMATYVSACGVCMMRGDRDGATRHEPDLSHMRPQTLDGQPADAWRTPAYLVEPVPAADAEQIEQDILDTLDAHVADWKAHDRGELPMPRPLYVDTIRPVYLAEWCQWCKIDFWAASGSSSERNAAHRGYHERAEQLAAGPPADPTVAPESFNTANGVLDGPAAVAMRAELVRQHAADLGVTEGEAAADLARRAARLDPAAARDRLLLADVPDELTPSFPAGTAEYEQYAAELTAELRKWTGGERPYGDGEPETAYDRLSEEYGQNENDHDRNPTSDGFVAWLAEQVERLRVEVAMRDAGRRAGLGVAGLVRAYGVQLGKGDAAGAGATLNAVQDHVGRLLAALALAGGERVRTVFDECAATLRAAGIDPEQLRQHGAPAGEMAGAPSSGRLVKRRRLYASAVPIVTASTNAMIAPVASAAAGPAPFEIGDRVTWGPAGQPENRGLIVWTVRRVWRDERGWHVAVRQNGGVGETGTAAPAEQFHRLPAMPAEHSVITFGYDHTHPDTGGRLDKMFVRIPGDRELARARAFALFGTAWAFDYSAATFAEQGQVERYGLIEVAPPSEAGGIAKLNDEQRAYVERQIAGDELDRLASALRYGTDGR